MDIIGKVLVGCIAAVLLVMSGTTVIMGNSDEVAANHYLDSTAKVILESNYNADVIDKCIDNAAENDYVLNVELIGSASAGKKQYAQIKLTYKYSLKLFGFEQEKTIVKMLQEAYMKKMLLLIFEITILGMVYSAMFVSVYNFFKFISSFQEASYGYKESY